MMLPVAAANGADRIDAAFQDSAMQHGPAGFVEAFAGYSWWEDEGFTGDAVLGGLRGTIAAPVGGAAGVQVDVQGEAWWWDEDAGIPSGDAQQGAVTGHLFLRDPERGSVGIVGGLWGVQSSARPGDDFFGQTIGLEGQLFTDMATLYGQAGYGHFDYPSTLALPDETHAFFATVGARLFLTENTLVDGKFAFAHNDSMIQDYQVYRGRVRAEHRIGGTPFSAFASYDYVTWSFVDGNEQVLRGGLRAYFGADTLLYNDRHGASQESLYNVMSWN